MSGHRLPVPVRKTGQWRSYRTMGPSSVLTRLGPRSFVLTFAPMDVVSGGNRRERESGSAPKWEGHQSPPPPLSLYFPPTTLLP